MAAEQGGDALFFEIVDTSPSRSVVARVSPAAAPLAAGAIVVQLLRVLASRADGSIVVFPGEAASGRLLSLDHVAADVPGGGLGTLRVWARLVAEPHLTILTGCTEAERESLANLNVEALQGLPLLSICGPGADAAALERLASDESRARDLSTIAEATRRGSCRIDTTWCLGRPADALAVREGVPRDQWSLWEYVSHMESSGWHGVRWRRGAPRPLPHDGTERVWVQFGKTHLAYLEALLSFDQLSVTEIPHLQSSAFYQALLAGGDGTEHLSLPSAVMPDGDEAALVFEDEAVPAIPGGAEGSGGSSENDSSSCRRSPSSSSSSSSSAESSAGGTGESSASGSPASSAGGSGDAAPDARAPRRILPTGRTLHGSMQMAAGFGSACSGRGVETLLWAGSAVASCTARWSQGATPGNAPDPCVARQTRSCQSSSAGRTLPQDARARLRIKLCPGGWAQLPGEAACLGGCDREGSPTEVTDSPGTAQGGHVTARLRLCTMFVDAPRHKGEWAARGPRCRAAKGPGAERGPTLARGCIRCLHVLSEGRLRACYLKCSLLLHFRTPFHISAEIYFH